MVDPIKKTGPKAPPMSDGQVYTDDNGLPTKVMNFDAYHIDGKYRKLKDITTPPSETQKPTSGTESLLASIERDKGSGINFAPVDIVIVYDSTASYYRQLFIAYVSNLIKEIESSTGAPPRIGLVFSNDGKSITTPLIFMDTNGKAKLFGILAKRDQDDNVDPSRNLDLAEDALIKDGAVGIRKRVLYLTERFQGEDVGVEKAILEGRGVELNVQNDLARSLRTKQDGSLFSWHEVTDNITSLMKAFVEANGDKGLSRLENEAARSGHSEFFFDLAAARILHPERTDLSLIGAIRKETRRMLLRFGKDSFFTDNDCTMGRVECEVLSDSQLLYLDMLREIGTENALKSYVAYAVEDYSPCHSEHTTNAPNPYTAIVRWGVDSEKCDHLQRMSIDDGKAIILGGGFFGRYSIHEPPPLDNILRYADMPKEQLIDALITVENANNFLSFNANEINPYSVHTRGLENLFDPESLSDDEREKLLHKIGEVLNKDITAGVIWTALFKDIPGVKDRLYYSKSVQALDKAFTESGMLLFNTARKLYPNARQEFIDLLGRPPSSIWSDIATSIVFRNGLYDTSDVFDYRRLTSLIFFLYLDGGRAVLGGMAPIEEKDTLRPFTWNEGWKRRLIFGLNEKQQKELISWIMYNSYENPELPELLIPLLRSVYPNDDERLRYVSSLLYNHIDDSKNPEYRETEESDYENKFDVLVKAHVLPPYIFQVLYFEKMCASKNWFNLFVHILTIDNDIERGAPFEEQARLISESKYARQLLIEGLKKSVDETKDPAKSFHCRIFMEMLASNFFKHNYSTEKNPTENVNPLSYKLIVELMDAGVFQEPQYKYLAEYILRTEIEDERLGLVLGHYLKHYPEGYRDFFEDMYFLSYVQKRPVLRVLKPILEEIDDSLEALGGGKEPSESILRHSIASAKGGSASDGQDERIEGGRIKQDEDAAVKRLRFWAEPLARTARIAGLYSGSESDIQLLAQYRLDKIIELTGCSSEVRSQILQTSKASYNPLIKEHSTRLLEKCKE